MVFRSAALLVGLTGYGFSMALMVRAGLGLDPWDVFHQGLAGRTGMTIGIASAVVGVVRAAGLDPAAQPAGIGTVANVIVIAVTVDAGLALLPDAIGTAGAGGDDARRRRAQRPQPPSLYIGAGLGPGPRDGLMTGLVARTGCRCAWSARRSRRRCSPSAGCSAAPSASARWSTRSASGRWCS